MKRIIMIMLAAVSIAACVKEVPQVTTLSSDSLKWEPLNPLRGDKSPQAAPLWGGLKSNVSTAFLVKFRDGFSSPPHIHLETYRAVVISGEVHNDDPAAEKMWMPVGSAWTQPAGEVHITAAKGETNIAYVEIDKGPYLVRPSAECYDNGERPVNIDESNFVWLGSKDVPWLYDDNVRVTFLWGNRTLGEFNGMMVKLPAGFKGKIRTKADIFKAVVVKGHVIHKSKNSENQEILDAGSYFGSKGKAKHEISTSVKEETWLYIRTNGEVKIRS